MRTKRRRIAAVIMIFLIVFSMGQLLSAATNEQQRNRYNVVFVTDESGSMDTTDPEKLRYEAIRSFNGLAAETGNYLGSVSFNDQIIKKQDIQAVEGVDQKNSFTDKVVTESAPGWTNIGLGLSAAVDMLDNSKNAELPAVIILLTDGNTEMGSAEEEENSLAEKADAIERAGSDDPEAIRTALSETQGFQAIFGELNCTEQGEMNTNLYILEFDGEKNMTVAQQVSLN